MYRAITIIDVPSKRRGNEEIKNVTYPRPPWWRLTASAAIFQEWMTAWKRIIHFQKFRKPSLIYKIISRFDWFFDLILFKSYK